MHELGSLPVVNFAAGGIATPADAALMMQLGVDGVFVGSVRVGGRVQGCVLSACVVPRCSLLYADIHSPSACVGYLQER